jgi:hypothetical protein
MRPDRHRRSRPLHDTDFQLSQNRGVLGISRDVGILDATFLKRSFQFKKEIEFPEIITNLARLFQHLNGPRIYEFWKKSNGMNGLGEIIYFSALQRRWALLCSCTCAMEVGISWPSLG